MPLRIIPESRFWSLEAFHRFVDGFIHPSLAADKVMRKQARLFLLSHFLGPFLGNGTALVLSVSDPSPGYELGVLFACISGFWVFPPLLRRFGRLELLALISIQNLTFGVLWVTYFYGGAASPFLPWMLTIPLLAFFYVGDSRTMRLMILVLLGLNGAAYYLISHSFEEPKHGISLETMQQLGLLSTGAIGLYVTMMALYYAKALASQSELETVMRHHMATASALRLAARRAEHASVAKVEFLAKMSHELRTPLNAIIGYSQMLLEEAEDGNSQDAQDLMQIQTSGQHLLRLVNGILDLARIDAGKMELFNERYSPEAVIRDVVREVDAVAAERGNMLEIQIDPGIGFVLGDQLKTHGAVGHLVQNAVKYTENGRVCIRAARKLSHGCDVIEVVVEDTGIGINREFLPTLFEQFAVSDEQTTTKYGGTGLGLALARKLCQLMGGDITVETRLGQGSRFTLVLPVEPPPEMEPAAGSRQEDGVRDLSPTLAFA